MSYSSVLSYESVDDLVDCLKYVRYIGQIDKLLNNSYKSNKNSYKSNKNSCNPKTITDTFIHLNHKMMLGIVSLGPKYKSENDIANILHDFTILPREMVLDRLKIEGAIIASPI
jgi:hypothetical protein